MRLLVTGGAGFIGSNFVRYVLAGAGSSAAIDRLVVIDSLTYAGNLANIADLEADHRFRFVRGDIRDKSAVSGLIAAEKLDTIINFAAESHVDRSILNPLEFVQTNVEGVQVLVNCALDSSGPHDGRGIKRLLQVSTDEVYGSLGPTGRFTESTPLDPSSTYSASKAAGDLLALAAHKTHGLNVVVTRCSNNYGPYQFPEKLIPLFITNALQDQPLPLYGDGKNIRSWLHVDDHSRALLLILEQGRAGEVYNIGGAPESEKENSDVTKEVLRILKKPWDLVRHVEDRKGHDRRYAVDYSKLKNELGWEPQVDFSSGLEATVQWYLVNEKWWRDVKSGSYQEFYQRYYGERLKS